MQFPHIHPSIHHPSSSIQPTFIHPYPEQRQTDLVLDGVDMKH
jgi:hypothetical protein